MQQHALNRSGMIHAACTGSLSVCMHRVETVRQCNMALFSALCSSAGVKPAACEPQIGDFSSSLAQLVQAELGQSTADWQLLQKVNGIARDKYAAMAERLQGWMPLLEVCILSSDTC